MHCYETSSSSTSSSQPTYLLLFIVKQKSLPLRKLTISSSRSREYSTEWSPLTLSILQPPPPPLFQQTKLPCVSAALALCTQQSQLWCNNNFYFFPLLLPIILDCVEKNGKDYTRSFTQKLLDYISLHPPKEKKHNLRIDYQNCGEGALSKKREEKKKQSNHNIFSFFLLQIIFSCRCVSRFSFATLYSFIPAAQQQAVQ